MHERVGSFRILDRLGEGGMGVVYAAHDDRLGRRVAIKMIRDVSSSREARERFWREARAAARINHPNVCQLYDVGEESGELWIAMDLLEGKSLAARLAEGDKVRTHPDFVRIMRRAEARRREALAAYLEHGGDHILGVRAGT